MKKINSMLIGYGYWGPKISRNLFQSERFNFDVVCEKDQSLRQKAKSDYGVDTYADYNKVLQERPEIEAVFIATPVSTHYDIAKNILKLGKHAFVEKPLTSTPEQARELVKIAEEKDLTLMVDHIFLFSGAVEKIKELKDKGELGEIYYIDSTRINLGRFQQNVNVIWDLAPHDLSIIDYILEGEEPIEYFVTKNKSVTQENYNQADIAYLTLKYSNNKIAHINISWLSPMKVRQTLIGGDEKMILYNDNEPENKLKVYDKGVNFEEVEDPNQVKVQYRRGGFYVPKLDLGEPLRKAVDHFHDCIMSNTTPKTDGKSGLRVVKILDKLDKN